MTRWTESSLYRWWQKTVVSTASHEEVVTRIVAESGWSGSYAFMTIMSAGIAVLGLLLSSPAVVIGAMLISPLMSPVLGLGFSLALLDYSELRRSLTALLGGALAAVMFSALIVLASPLQSATAEILARTRPNLFDLLVALFAGLAGSYAFIRGRGATIVGVAIATALMPPLAVVGYGLATTNMPVLGGSLALFVTNCVTIALSAAFVARFYGFTRYLSIRQSGKQVAVLLTVFVGMSIPLGLSLKQIAEEALLVKNVRSWLGDQYGPDSRVTQLDIDFDEDPIDIRAVLIAPPSNYRDAEGLRAGLSADIGKPVSLQVDQILLDDPGSRSVEKQRAELVSVPDPVVTAAAEGREIARAVAAAAGVAPEAVTLDDEQKRVVTRTGGLPGAGLATWRALERRVNEAYPGWTVEFIPPPTDLPVITFADGVDSLDAAAAEGVDISAWAVRRWGLTELSVPGLPATTPERPLLAQRRGLVIATRLQALSIAGVPAPRAGREFRLGASLPPPDM